MVSTPSYIVNIWKKHYSRYLLPLQKDAVRNYGILNCGGNEEGRMLYAPTEGIWSYGARPCNITFYLPAQFFNRSARCIIMHAIILLYLLRYNHTGGESCTLPGLLTSCPDI